MSTSIWTRVLVVGIVLSLSSLLLAQQAAHQEARTEDNLQPDEFTDIIKEAWTFLKDETQALLNATAKKTEFETSQEFEKRVAELRKQYLAKTTKFFKDKKYDQREFGVLFKANLVSTDLEHHRRDSVRHPLAAGEPQ
jgi:hypothetical protein